MYCRKTDENDLFVELDNSKLQKIQKLKFKIFQKIQNFKIFKKISKISVFIKFQNFNI
jgi:hypothetical protein